MSDRNAVVSTTIRFDPPLDRAPAQMLGVEGGLSVVLDDERRVRLDPSDRRSAGFVRVLDGLRQQGLPVYLELDPATSAITRLLIPHVTRVLSLRPAGAGGIEVVLERSHSRHLLSADSPDFAELEKRVRAAAASGRPVILTEDDAHRILDIRDFEPRPGFPLPPPLPPPEPPPRPWRPLRWIRDLLHWAWVLIRWPWCWFRCVSMGRAQQIFDALAATSCDPLTVPPPCIPFLYPDDGCWGRAHEMCRLMIGMGRSPKKVWIQGSLHVSTPNNPNCYVNWGWHVAPTLCVRGPWFFCCRQMVLDPALFTTPVSQTSWKGIQGDPAATLTPSDASIFYLWGSVTDPAYTQTNQVLATYRLQLQNRANQLGPPPYANCP